SPGESGRFGPVGPSAVGCEARRCARPAPLGPGRRALSFRQAPSSWSYFRGTESENAVPDVPSVPTLGEIRATLFSLAIRVATSDHPLSLCPKFPSTSQYLTLSLLSRTGNSGNHRKRLLQHLLDAFSPEAKNLASPNTDPHRLEEAVSVMLG